MVLDQTRRDPKSKATNSRHFACRSIPQSVSFKRQLLFSHLPSESSLPANPTDKPLVFSLQKAERRRGKNQIKPSSSRSLANLTLPIVEKTGSFSPLPFGLFCRVRKEKDDGCLQSRRWLRLSVQGRLDWRFRSWEVEFAIEVYEERVQPRIEVDNRRRVRHAELERGRKGDQSPDLGHGGPREVIFFNTHLYFCVSDLGLW